MVPVRERTRIIEGRFLMIRMSELRALADYELESVSGGDMSFSEFLGAAQVVIETVTARPFHDLAQQRAGDAVKNAIEVIKNTPH